MKPEYKTILEQINKNLKTVKKGFDNLRKMRKGEVDELIHTLNDEVFDSINCLECANCCTTTGPLLKDKDIERLSKHFNIKPSQFIDIFLKIDEDNDYVFKSLPCPFLGEDKYCSVYDDRPKACREYPHTDRVNQLGILSITRKNVEICPAVAQIFINIDKNYKG